MKGAPVPGPDLGGSRRGDRVEKQLVHDSGPSCPFDTGERSVSNVSKKQIRLTRRW